MNEEDYKSLIATYQRKSMDLFAQLVVAETKVEVLNTQLRDAKSRIQQLEEEIKSKLREQRLRINILNACYITGFLGTYHMRGMNALDPRIRIKRSARSWKKTNG